jgi:outer membrane protein assembly factor BamB
MKTITSFLLISLFGLGCKKLELTTKTNTNGVTVEVPLLWGASTTDGPPIGGFASGKIYQNKVLCIGSKKLPNQSNINAQGHEYLMFKDINTGKTVWEWDDTRLPFNDYFSTTDGYFFESSRLFINAGRNHYCINTQTGQTIWKEKRTETIKAECLNIGNSYFVIGNVVVKDNPQLYITTIFGGNTENAHLFREIVRPNYNPDISHIQSNFVGSNQKPAYTIVKKDTLLFIPFVEVVPHNQQQGSRSLIGLYNLSKKNWIYDRHQVSDPANGGGLSRVIIDGDKVYATKETLPRKVVCLELMTGKTIWETPVENYNTPLINLELTNGEVIVTTGMGNIIVLQREAGYKVWAKDVGGAINGTLQVQDGIVYCIANKNLKAIEVATGKLLWDIPSPDIKLNKISDSWFQGFVTGIPAKDGQKGKIIATTDHSIYCFEAIK